MLTKITLKITSMHCTSCAFNIDGKLEDTEGVREATTSYARQETKITFDSDMVKLDKIKKILRTLGYEVILSQ